MREFGLSRENVLYELPEAEGRAMIAWAAENNGVKLDRCTPGYVAQEIEKRKHGRHS